MVQPVGRNLDLVGDEIGIRRELLQQHRGTEWSVGHTGDYNGDGKADILWHNANGAVSVWTSTGSGFASNALYDAGPDNS